MRDVIGQRRLWTCLNAALVYELANQISRMTGERRFTRQVAACMGAERRVLELFSASPNDGGSVFGLLEARCLALGQCPRGAMDVEAKTHGVLNTRVVCDEIGHNTKTARRVVVGVRN